jgi:hypothetical protein
VIAAVFGFWDQVIPEDRLFRANPQLALVTLKGPRKAEAPPAVTQKKAADDEG